MAYSIHKSNGALVSVADNTKDTDFYSGAIPPGVGKGIILIGRNDIDYGASIAQNFLQLTENFASDVAPADGTALQGQLWFNTADGILYVRSGTGGTFPAGWGRIVTLPGNQTGSVPIVNPAAGTEKDGDIQVLTGPTRINIRAAGAWHQVFPAQYS